MDEMSSIQIVLWISIAFFVGMLALLEAGRRIGARRIARDSEGARTGVGAVEGAVFGLLGLLLAFTFSTAASRFDARRQQIVEEANAIGTAWLRLNLMPADAQPALRDLFRRYLDSRLETYRLLPDIDAAQAELARSAKLQREIWTPVAAVAETRRDAAITSLIMALNAMFDISTTRLAATRTHQPPVIFVLLFGLGLGCALLAGYGLGGAGGRSWLHMIAFAAVIAAAVYVILDLEYPRLGLIRVESADRVLLELRESMK
jgi:hypothetical protein